MRDSPDQSIDDLKDKKIASSYPNSAKRFFGERGEDPEVITLSGSVEVAPALGFGRRYRRNPPQRVRP